MASLEELIIREYRKPPGSAIGAANLEDRIMAEYEGKGGITPPTPSQVVPEEQLGPPGLESLKARFGISEGRTFGEKLKGFQSSFPEGELVLTNVSKPSPFAEGQRDISSERQLLFRRNANESFSKVDAGALEKFEPLADIVDFMGGDIGSAIGQIIALTPANKTISVLPLMGRLFAGGAAGEALQQGVQTLRGTQEESGEDILAGSVMKGGAAAAGGAAGNVLTKFWNALKGGGLLSLNRGAEEAIEASSRLGVPRPIAPQLAINPAFKRAAAQSAAASSSIKRYVDEQGQAAVRALDRIKPPAGINLEQALSTVESQERNMILNRTRSLLARRVEAPEAGRRVQQLIDNWDDVAKTNVNKLYQKARTIEKPEFDLTPAINEAKNIERGVIAAGKGEAPVVEMEKAFGDVVPVFKSAGKPGGQIRVSGTKGDPVQSEVLDVVNTMKQMEPGVIEITTQDGKLITGVDQLNALRKRLYDAKTPAVGEKPREAHAIAQRLYSAITDVIENPTNKSPGFVTAWQQANRAAANRFDTLDKVLIHKALGSETPSQLAIRLIQPNQAENLALLKGLGQEQKYRAVQDNFKTRLLDKPETLLKTLDSYDTPTLNLLMDKPEQAIFRDVGSKLQRLDSLGIKQAIEKQSERGALAIEALNSGDSRAVQQYAALVQKSGGPQSPLGQSFRAGLIDNILGSVKKYEKAGEAIDFNKLNTVIADYEKKGLMKFLTPADVQHLKDQRVVAEMVKQVQDAGTSIAGAEAAGDIVYRTNTKALYHMARLMGFGRLLIMPSVNSFLIGTGKAKSTLIPLKMASGILGSTLVNLEKEEQQ